MLAHLTPALGRARVGNTLLPVLACATEPRVSSRKRATAWWYSRCEARVASSARALSSASESASTVGRRTPGHRESFRATRGGRTTTVARVNATRHLVGERAGKGAVPHVLVTISVGGYAAQDGLHGRRVPHQDHTVRKLRETPPLQGSSRTLGRYTRKPCSDSRTGT